VHNISEAQVCEHLFFSLNKYKENKWSIVPKPDFLEIKMYFTYQALHLPLLYHQLSTQQLQDHLSIYHSCVGVSAYDTVRVKDPTIVEHSTCA
jgi:hypothetical protein